MITWFANKSLVALATTFFGIPTDMWMNLQLDYEFMRADHKKGEAIRKEVHPSAA